MTTQNDDLLVIDADAHILEPPDLWERYLDPAFRDRPICIKTDERGLEYLEIDGKMSKRNSGGMLFAVGGALSAGAGFRRRRGPRWASPHGGAAARMRRGPSARRAPTC